MRMEDKLKIEEFKMIKRIESSKNPKIKQWKKLQTKKEREKSGLFMIEGIHLIEEAFKYHVNIIDIVIHEQFTIPADWDVANIELSIVPKEIFNEICHTETPQGVAAICEKINFEKTVQLDRVLLLDAVQDPGNLGTMIRTADAAGIDAVILGIGCADPYNSKVIRSTQGSIFHIPILQGDLHEWFQTLKEQNTPIYGTSLQNGKDYKQVDPTEKFALVVGNEGAGVDHELLLKTTQNLYIPIYGHSESLNVAIAAGILLYYLRS